MVRLLIAVAGTMFVAACASATPTPAATATAPAIQSAAVAATDSPPLSSSPAAATLTPSAAPRATATEPGLALGPLTAGAHQSSFHAPFTFTAGPEWQVTGDSKSQLALVDANDPASAVTIGLPFGYPDAAALLAAWKAQKLKMSPNPATLAGVVGMRTDYSATDFIALYPTRELGDTLFALNNGEVARLFVADVKGNPVVITIEAADQARFKDFAPRAEKLLATMKFLP